MIQLSLNYTLIDALRSEEARKHNVLNTPTADALIQLSWTCSKILEPLSIEIGPVRPSSFYRNRDVNRLVGGSSNSRHLYGLAVDIPPQNGRTAKQIFMALIRTGIEYDKIIWERNRSGSEWVHAQISEFGLNPRRRKLTGFYNHETKKYDYKTYKN